VLGYPPGRLSESTATQGGVSTLSFLLARVVFLERFFRLILAEKMPPCTHHEPALRFGIESFAGNLFIVIGFVASCGFKRGRELYCDA